MASSLFWMRKRELGYDNALCESFFATLECELLDRQRFATPADARLAVLRSCSWPKQDPLVTSSLGSSAPAQPDALSHAAFPVRAP